MTRFPMLPLLVAALASAGCAAASQSLATGRRLRAEDVRAIVPGRTTKGQLFALLGPPIAIAGAGEVVQAPSVQMRARVGLERAPALEPHHFEGSYPIQGDALLELFADDVAPTPDQRVHLFRAHEEICSRNFCRTVTRHLWVLVDEATGRVVGVRPNP